MASMKDVAKLAGVSASTVSRVISGAMKVEEPTKKKVEEAIAKVNYKPNILAQGLRIKSGKMIGLIVPEINHPTFVNFINYSEEYAREKSLSLVLCNTHNNPEESAKAFDELLRRNIDGIILSRVSDESQVIDLVSKTNTPVIILDRALEHEKIPNVILNNYKAGEIAAEHIVKSGRKRVACVTGSRRIRLVRERLDGFRNTLNLHGIQLEEQYIFEGKFSFQTGIDAFLAFQSTSIEIDAIWAQSDLIAMGLITSLQRNGISVPRDTIVVGMDDIVQSTMMYPTITSVTQPFSEMCWQAIDLIDKMAKGESVNQDDFVFEPGLVIRESAP